MDLIATAYALATGVLLVYGINLLWLSRGFVQTFRSTSQADEESSYFEYRPVTIQLPVFNERYVVERLIDACCRLDYPKQLLDIQVLDDSTDETGEIAARRVETWRRRGIDIVHVRRSDRDGFKAGALQNGLRFARGEFVAVFDADFVPQPDFIKRVLPTFSDPRVGMVQTRWSFLNDHWSLLTRIQALSLDAHFAIEQFVRNRLGYFINFNGTAGVWRTACIEEAGGWQGDTLTEDLDLSYRAQLKGWSFVFKPSVETPSELPVDLNSLRSQQFRWTKGSVQTALKLLPSLLRSDNRLGIKLEGIAHLTCHLVFPFVILAALLHAPVTYLRASQNGPGEAYFGLLALGILALAGVFLVQLFAQRSLYPDWFRRMRHFPLFVAGSMGFSINNTIAITDALVGRDSPFVRTPKLALDSAGQGRNRLRSAYATLRLSPVALLELFMGVYSVAGLVVIATLGAWVALPFQVLFALGFGLVSGSNIYQLRRAART